MQIHSPKVLFSFSIRSMKPPFNKAEYGVFLIFSYLREPKILTRICWLQLQATFYEMELVEAFDHGDIEKFWLDGFYTALKFFIGL